MLAISSYWRQEVNNEKGRKVNMATVCDGYSSQFLGLCLAKGWGGGGDKWGWKLIREVLKAWPISICMSA